MAAKQDKNRNRYRTMRSAILTGSLLSILPLFALMKGGAGNTIASTALATNGQGIAVAASPAQTVSSQSTAGQASASTSSNTKASTATTHTRTRAS